MTVIEHPERCTCEYLIDLEDGTGPHHRPGCPALGETEVERLTRQLTGAVEANAALREAVKALCSAIYCGEPMSATLQGVVDRALTHPGGQS